MYKNRARVFAPAAAAIILLLTASCNQSAPPEEVAEPTNPLQGVWAMTTMTTGEGEATVDPAQPGLFIFTDEHYSAVYSLGADPRPLSATAFSPTPEEMIAQYEAIIVNTGTYEVSGTTITFRPLVAKSPEFIGGHSTMDYQIDGNMLTLSVTSIMAADGNSPPDGSGDLMRLTRLR